MKSLRTIFKYVSHYPKLVAAYFSFNILSALFSVISLGLLSPFLLLIFKKQDISKSASADSGFLNKINPVEYVKTWLNDVISKPNGDITALGYICIIILISIILKNICLYLSMYYLNPIRNNIINDMRTKMYKKILSLPIGYFSEQRKGDIMSRLTNDLGDVEGSAVSVLETIFREPITILFSSHTWLY